MSDALKEMTLLAFQRGYDVLVSLLTGYLCYAALPEGFDKTILRTRRFESIVIIVSQLIALMKDQVSALSAKGLAVSCVSSRGRFDHAMIRTSEPLKLNVRSSGGFRTW